MEDYMKVTGITICVQDKVPSLGQMVATTMVSSHTACDKDMAQWSLLKATSIIAI